MMMKRIYVFSVIGCLCLVSLAEAIVDNNLNYGFIYWEYGIPTQFVGRRPQSDANLMARANPNIIIQTGYYSLRLDCDDMELTGYDALTGSDYMTALYDDVHVFTPAQLNLYVDKGGERYRCTSGVIQTKEATYVRLIENGQFVQRFDHTGLVFTTSKGRGGGEKDLGVYGRLEITAWPDRVTFLLDFRDYDGDPLVSGITGTAIELVSPAGKTHAVVSSDDHAYLAVQPHLDVEHKVWKASDYITKAVEVRSQDSLSVHFDRDEHALTVGVPADRVSWPRDLDRVDKYLIEVTNPQNESVNIPIVFDHGSPRAVTGTVMVLCEEADGAPTGIPVQISKDWHKTSEHSMIHQGSWLRGSTAFMLAPGERKRFCLKIIYGHWGGVPAASHAQLSLIGWGLRNNWKWDESTLGAWGENMTFDPTLHAGAAFMCDIRPSFTQGYKSGTPYNWTENSGGGDFLIYYDSSNRFRWAKRIKTAYRWTGPNLTEVHYSGVTDDDKIRFTYISQLPRSYDYHRRFQSFKVEFLQAVTAPRRLVFYQMAADYYSGPTFDDYDVGDIHGLRNEYTSSPGGNRYKGSFPFMKRWLSINDEMASHYSAHARRGLLWRRFTLNGEDFDSHFHTYGRSWGTPKMLFDLSSSSVRRSYQAGDVVEGRLDYIMAPKTSELYWGEDAEFNGRLATYRNRWGPIFDEYRYNQLNLTVHMGTLVNNYPIEIKAADSNVLADVTIQSGGVGHVPLILTNVPRGGAVAVQRLLERQWRWLEGVNIEDHNYYQGYQNANGTMDYVFTIHRPSNDLSASWRIRVLKQDVPGSTDTPRREIAQ